jgi:uncharacterized protein DUF6295
MCTYATHQCAVSGSGKSGQGWIPISTASVYVDHPVHTYAEHTLNIDFLAPEGGPASRVALELQADCAIALLSTVATALLAAPADITGLGEAERGWLARLLAVDPEREPESVARP